MSSINLCSLLRSHIFGLLNLGDISYGVKCDQSGNSSDAGNGYPGHFYNKKYCLGISASKAASAPRLIAGSLSSESEHLWRTLHAGTCATLCGIIHDMPAVNERLI